MHDTRKQGLVLFLTETARQKGTSAYDGDGANRWAAAQLADMSHLYRMVLQQAGTGRTVYNEVKEEGATLRKIAETIGKGLKITTVSLDTAEAADHFGWLAYFAGLDTSASSTWTRKALKWETAGPVLIEDLMNMR